MKNLNLLSAILLQSSFTMAQVHCLPEGINFSSQAQIDNFQENFPGCTEIEGYVTIEGEDINNVAGLEAVTSVGGYLIIENNVNLKSFTGLSNLTHIGGWCWVFENDSLTSFAGLENLVSIGGDLQIDGNNSLFSLSGLDHLASVGGGLFILANPHLGSLDALGNLTSIGMDGVMIDHNSELTYLAGLDNIDGGTITYLFIGYNIQLSECHVESICDFLASPDAIVEIYINAPGCDSREEVEEACDAQGIAENDPFSLTILPNPTHHGRVTLKYNKPSNNLRLTCFNTFGKPVYQQDVSNTETVIHLSGWSPGIYLAVLYEDGMPVGRGKFLVR